jgi:hypothetical protein
MRQACLPAVIAVGLLVFWTTVAGADKIKFCFAAAQSICGTNGHGSDKFIQATQLEVLSGLSVSRTLEAAKKFRKADKEIKKISDKNFSSLYQVAEFDCEKK